MKALSLPTLNHPSAVFSSVASGAGFLYCPIYADRVQNWTVFSNQIDRRRDCIQSGQSAKKLRMRSDGFRVPAIFTVKPRRPNCVQHCARRFSRAAGSHSASGTESISQDTRGISPAGSPCRHETSQQRGRDHHGEGCSENDWIVRAHVEEKLSQESRQRQGCQRAQEDASCG